MYVWYYLRYTTPTPTDDDVLIFYCTDIMNDEITNVQDNDIHQDTVIYDDDGSQLNDNDLIFNEEITQVQDNVLHEDTATYFHGKSQHIDAIADISSIEDNLGHVEDGQISDVSIIAHGRDDDNMEIGLVYENEVLSVLSMLSLSKSREELIALLDENSSIEGNIGHFENMDDIMNPLGLDD